MNRKILALLLAIFILTGLAFSAVPYLNSLKPANLVKGKIKLRVDLRKMPVDSIKIFSWQGYKVFVVKHASSQNVFLMPYQKGIYQLPDPDWARAVVACEKFRADLNGFSCVDKKLSNSWRARAQWGIDGKARNKKTPAMPDMQTAPYKIFGSYIVISSEYKKMVTATSE